MKKRVASSNDTAVMAGEVIRISEAKGSPKKI
jgi:hypothetical protein